MKNAYTPRILVLASVSCAYPGADEVGKAHLEYPSNINILRVPSPVLFPEDFYLRCYAKGIDAILVASCGTDCPFRGAYNRLAKRIDKLATKMKIYGLEVDRLRLTAICTVCTRAFLNEVNQLNARAKSIGPVNKDIAEKLWKDSLRELGATFLPI
jgi:coenzyme F420-reducing hydrogenase delta subunit